MEEKLAKLKLQALNTEKHTLEIMLADETSDPNKLDAVQKLVTMKYNSYLEAQRHLMDVYLQNDQEDEFLNEEKNASALHLKMDALSRASFRFLSKYDQPPVVDTRIRLPKLELLKFDGDIKNWLAFRASFEDVHNNVQLTDENKFQYLMKCLPEGSPARRVISGIPFSGKNYNTAWDMLVKQFGRESTLVKYYMRELLKLATRNTNEKTRLSLIDLVPQITSQIRNLEELGITRDKFETVLYPVVESCLPDDVLREWQRDPMYDESLEAFLDFLTKEVQNTLDRSLSRMDFSGPAPTERKPKKEKDDVPTASALIASDIGDATSNSGEGCIFCGGVGHRSTKCRKGYKMTIQQRQEVVRKLNLCYVCLRKGHRSSNCTFKVNCTICQGKHYNIMCNVDAPVKPGKSRSSMMAPGYPTPQDQSFFQCYPQQQVQQYQPASSYMMTQQPQQQYQFAPAPVQQQQPPAQQGTASFPPGVNQPIVNQAVSKRPQSSHQQPTYTTASTNVASRGKSVLMTLLVLVETPSGLKQARVLVDTGSEESYVLIKTAKGLTKKRVGESLLAHQVFMGEVTPPAMYTRYQVQLTSLNQSTAGVFEFFAVPAIAKRIPKPLKGKWDEDLWRRGILLHDQRDATEEVQFMFGVDIAAYIWTGGFVRLEGNLVARETIFGWGLEGVVKNTASRDLSSTHAHMTTSFLLRQMTEEDLWSLEVLGITEESRTQTKEDLEKATEEFFKNTVQIDSDFRYEVRLPWTSGHKAIESNKGQTIARLHNVTRSLQVEGYLEAYDTVFQTWKAAGIVEEVPDGERNVMEYYLPHRHVVKPNSTTPVRPVFDASAKARGSVSLNDCLEKGPNRLELIPAIMTRFRRLRYGLVSDIEKAFLQLSLHPEDRKMLQFMWWMDLNCKEIQVYRHRRVVFGVKSSPYLLAATLDYHLERMKNDFEEIAEKLKLSFYVDNSVSSHCSMEDAKRFESESAQIMQLARMNLRGWEYAPAEEEKTVAVLGMSWNTKRDTLSFVLENTLKKLEGPLTKRGLLAAINSIFDPMGFLAPFTLVSKNLFQRSCMEKLNWDDMLPDDIAAEFSKWKEQVPMLVTIEIPRWMAAYEGEVSVSLHVFSDASCLAFSACAFLRVVSKTGEVSVQLVMCRSRVAPSKRQVTIPRLELLGCLIAVRLAKEVMSYLKNEDIVCCFWSDSSTALAWIKNDRRWGTFVQNRVDEIRASTTPEQWRHVPGDLNPADLPSRGCYADRLITLQWWEGPQWLKKGANEWPVSAFQVKEDEVSCELRKTVIASTCQVTRDPLDYIRKFSSYSTVVRIMAMVIRFVDKLRHQVYRRKQNDYAEDLVVMKGLQGVTRTIRGSTFEEIEKAELAIQLFIQRTGVVEESLKKKSLPVFKDENGLLRVKSQLFYGSDEYATRCPVLLAGKHETTRAIILAEHEQHCHAGPQTTSGLLRQRYWIIDGRRTINSVISKCPACRVFTAPRCNVTSAPLPKNRIKDTAVFDVTGVDLFGPMFLAGGDKVWVVLFTCAVYRGVHLEITPTLSTEGFIRALRRFVARRGRPATIYSDNGLNFVGSNNLFANIDWEKVMRYAAVKKIQWIFNPPTAAWWGGFWERLVGSCKRQLRRVLGKRVTNLEELQTIMCDVEDTVNRRPLTYLSDVDPLIPLTPATFMRDNGESGIPEADVIDEESLRAAARRSQKIRQEFRSRFRREYLGSLKHLEGSRSVDIKPGDVVLIEHDNKKRLDWPLGVVKTVYPGRDGKIRSALVKTTAGEFLRPVQRLFMLEASLTAVEKVQPASDGVPADMLEESREAKENPQPAAEDVPAGRTSRYGRKLKKPDRLGVK